MPTAPYGDEAFHALMTAGLGAAHASKPRPVKLVARAGRTVPAAAGAAARCAAFSRAGPPLLAAGVPPGAALGSEALARICRTSAGSVS